MITYRVNSYSVLAFAGDAQPVRLYLYGDPDGGDQERYIGYIDFKDTVSRKFILHSNGIVNAFMPADKLSAMLDLVRHEEPVFFTINESYNWAGLKTGKEPTGEEETEATA